MSGFPEYDQYDATGLASLVANGSVTPEALLEEAIARAERVNPSINAIVEPLHDYARELLRAGIPEGPFSGVPFLLKDLGQAMRAAPMRNGSRYFADYVPDYDSEMVARFKRAGLVTFGKTNTPELGLVGTTEPRLSGPTRNPWAAERVAGGSSGGAAAAVAAGIVPMASASDGGGSIRIPAACVGLVGLKPSRGRNPSGPELGEGWYGQVQHGVISRSVRDTAAALDATAGGDAGMPYCAPPPPLRFIDEAAREPGALRVAVCRTPLCAPGALDPECLRGLDHTIKLLESLGHHVVEADPPLDRMPLACAFMLRIMACTAAEVRQAEAVIGRAPARHDLEPVTRAFANLARSWNAVDLTLANRTIEAQMRGLGRFMQDYDVLVTPTLACPPPLLGVFEPRGADALLTALASRVPLGPLPRWGDTLEQLVTNNFTFVVSTMVANMSGEPSITLPLHWTADNLPVGMMFTAPLYEEATLLRLAGQIETAQPWRDQRPPIHAGVAA